jgi:predicted ATPase
MHLSKVILHPEKYPTRNVYPFSLDILQRTECLAFTRPVTLFVGENGAGKSTLLRAICLKCGIHIWEDVERSRYYPNRHEGELYKYLEVEWTQGSVPGSFFASQIFCDFARGLDEWARATPEILDYFGGGSLLTQSHGQSLITYFSTRYRIKGLYFMDEPETALSPKSQLALLKILQEIGRAGHAQFIIASHSPILLAYPGATIYSFDQIPVKEINYRDTEYYRLYRDFLNHPERYLGGV